jgi:hypothetical protein
MKKIVYGLIFLIILGFSGMLYAADAMTVTPIHDSSSNLIVVKIDWTDSPNLTLESQSTGINNLLAGWYCYGAETVPGSGAAQPDNLYDIVVTNAAGTDIFDTALTNRSNTGNETALTVFNSAKGPFPIKPRGLSDALTITITGQTTAAGTGTIYLYFARY